MLRLNKYRKTSTMSFSPKGMVTTNTMPSETIRKPKTFFTQRLEPISLYLLFIVWPV